MSIRSRRLLLLSSSALVLLCFAGIASSQTTETPPETPPATTTTPQTPATTTPAPETPAPQPSQPAPETPQAEPRTAPTLSVPQVTVEAPKPRSARRTAPAAPARTATRPPPAPPPTPTTPPPTAPSATTTAGQQAAPSPFQPPPSLTTLNSEQIQASQSNTPLHHARRHLRRSRTRHATAGATRPRRFPRARAGERRRHHGRFRPRPGPWGAARSAGDSEDPDPSRPGRAALQLAGGRRHRGSDQQPHSLPGAAGRLANANPRRHHHGRPGRRRRRIDRRGLARLRLPRRRLWPQGQRLLHPELSLSFPLRSRAAVQRQAAELLVPLRGTGGRRLLPVRRRLCGRRNLSLQHALSCSHHGRRGVQHAHRD